jgi:ketol-acid reductoisomerase
VTLFSSEAEYVAMSEAVKEIRFIYFILCDIGIEVELQVVVKTDNVGAMFTTQNSSTGVRSRHVDTRYHFIRENVENGIVKVEFVNSNENDFDIFTKNVSKETYERHTMMGLSLDLRTIQRL